MTANHIYTVAGTDDDEDYTGDGGQAISATFSSPTSVALDSSGNLYIADSGNDVIRKVAH